MPEVQGSIVINRPVPDVFAFMAVPSNSSRWERGVVLNELTSEGPMAVGAKGRRVERLFGQDEGTWEVTEFERDQAIGVAFQSGLFEGAGRWTMAVEGAGTRLAYDFHVTPRKMPWKVLVPLMMPLFNRQIRRDYGKLKSILESES